MVRITYGPYKTARQQFEIVFPLRIERNFVAKYGLCGADSGSDFSGKKKEEGTHGNDFFLVYLIYIRYAYRRRYF